MPRCAAWGETGSISSDWVKHFELFDWLKMATWLERAYKNALISA